MAIKTKADEIIDNALRNAKASLEIENQFLPDGGEDLILKSLHGEITHAEFMKRALVLALRD